MAMIGLPKSPSVIPVARHRLRAPAMLRPWVVVRERYGGMDDPKMSFVAQCVAGGLAAHKMTALRANASGQTATLPYLHAAASAAPARKVDGKLAAPCGAGAENQRRCSAKNARLRSSASSQSFAL